ncbi:MAG: HepT-like ribonuclease domain-containing protein [Candidatus Marinimicrobia bacterium]|nr:HepT-like ribonuclease domain-containing protein [Candidatus Neomarinimicrobiota bacterium]
MYNKDETIILMMLDIIEKIFRYTSELSNPKKFFSNEKTFDATMMNFIALGEIISKISNEFKETNNDIDWREIYDFRNIVAHDYFGIDEYEVWEIIKKHLPKLKNKLEKILRS